MVARGAGCELILGGVRFVLEPPSGVRVVEGDPNYRPFLGPGWTPGKGGAPAFGASGPEGSKLADSSRAGAPESCRRVVLALEPPPETESLPVLFDTGQSWRAHGDGEDVLLHFPGREGPLWVARVPQDGAITVSCGSGLLSPDGSELTNPLHYPLDQLLTMFTLASRQGVLVHAAGVARGGRGVVLAGPSGAGKSTFMELCRGRTGIRGLSDDRVIVRRWGKELRVWGTPWAGQGAISANDDVGLECLAFLHQGEGNELRPLTPQAALARLVPTASILWFDPRRLEPALAFCAELVRAVPVYELSFRPEAAAADLLAQLWS